MYRKYPQSWLKHIDFMLIDVLVMHISFVIAYCLRHGVANPYSDILYGNIAIVFTLIQIIVSIFAESFKDVLKRGYYKEFVATIKHEGIIILFACFYMVMTQRGEEFSRLVLFWMGLIYFILGYVARILWKQVLQRKMINSTKRSLLILTAKNEVAKVANNIKEHNYSMFRLSGISVMDEDWIGKTISGIPVVANSDNVIEYVCREWVDEVFLVLPEGMECPRKLCNQFIEMGIVVHINLENGTDLVAGNRVIEHMGNYTVMTYSMNYISPIQLVIKRLMDIAGGLVGCMVTGILFLIVAPFIYKESPGPIFFAQERVGKNGRKFKMYKFRSMYLDAEERKKELMEKNRVKDGMMFKLDWDPRIIGSRMVDGKPKKGIGNYIRDLSIDEFPQFFNVLKGNMSLVGTRPPTIDEWEKYESHHRARMATKPGITGMWQVSGRSNITDFEEVVRLDTQYISEWNIGLDIKILLKTVLVVLKKEGSM